MILRHPSLDDAALVHLIYSNSKVGAEALYDRYASVLMLVIFHIIPQKKIAEGVLEETFLVAWNSIDEYSLERERFLSWVVRIARKLANDSKYAEFTPH